MELFVASAVEDKKPSLWEILSSFGSALPAERGFRCFPCAAALRAWQERQGYRVWGGAPRVVLAHNSSSTKAGGRQGQELPSRASRHRRAGSRRCRRAGMGRSLWGS